MLSEIYQAIDNKRSELIEIAQQIHAQPELAYEEKFASQLLATALDKNGFQIEKPYASLDTAFCAQMTPSSNGPTLAILAEYDALPEVGHACGHNLIGAAAIGAGMGLNAIKDSLPGQILIMGTPAEEGGGGKLQIIEAGMFENIDAAMMFHPFDRNLLAFEALAMHTVEFEFYGKSSHAAAAPWDGNSAVSAVIQTFNLIDNTRLHFKDKTRVHGIILHGGDASNIIPEYASCRFSVRAKEAEYLDKVVIKRVIQCAEAAAMATNTKVKTKVEIGYKNLKSNIRMAEVFGDLMSEFDLDYMMEDDDSPMGSTDMGDVSQLVPAIHPMLAICDRNEAMCHQHKFAELTKSDAGFETMITAAKLMAGTAYRLLTEPELLAEVKAEFNA